MRLLISNPIPKACIARLAPEGGDSQLIRTTSKQWLAQYNDSKTTKFAYKQTQQKKDK